MISRVAENCFWLSRYLERAENAARVLDVNHSLLLDLEVPLEQQWRPVLIISGIHDYPGDADAETVQRHMTWEANNPCSIVACLAAGRENARIIREVISAEMWERINFYHLWLQGAHARLLYERSRSEFYGQVRRINQLISGIAEGTMSHGEAWEFFQFGKYLERACQTARILDVKYHILLPTPQHIGTPVDNAHWVAILTSCSGYEPYHKKHRSMADPGSAVADFLIFDPLFPRSVRRCVAECLGATRAISGGSDGEVERLLTELHDWLSRTDIRAVIRAGLHESLLSVVSRIHAIGEAVRKQYFDVRVEPPPPPHTNGRMVQTQSQNGPVQGAHASQTQEQ
jgi:uncharacterized alpha-E superfamily protein